MKIIFLKWVTGILSFWFFLSGSYTPSNDLSNRVEQLLKTYRINYGPEKIYIHHDKSFYEAGEILWLKIYIRNAYNLKATSKSGIVYVTLLDERKEVIDRLILPISDGVAHGDLLLREELTRGFYYLTAYTQWARNFGEENFFQKEIYIQGPEKADLWPPLDLLDPEDKNARLEHYRSSYEPVETEPILKTKPSISLQFFPEGGDLIGGLTNEVAFKAVDSTGYGISFSATLLNSKGKEILDFQDSHHGIGSFVFKPESDEEYFAELILKNGENLKIPLPKVVKYGYVLHVDEIRDEDHIMVRISTNTDENQPLTLFGISREELVHVEEVPPLVSQDFETQIPKSLFPDGIVRFTLARENGDPIAERLVFNRRDEKFQLEVQVDKTVYYPREKVNISLEMKGHPLEESNLTNLSMAVTREDFASVPKEGENIQTYLLLTSDLRGHIESPGYYFENNDKVRQMALRQVMMTHGWRRFDWNAILTQEFPQVNYINELVLSIQGKLVRSTGAPVSKGQVVLYILDQYDSYISTTTDEYGVFNFYDLYFEDFLQMVIHGTDDRGRSEDLEIHIFNLEFPTFSDQGILFPRKHLDLIAGDYVQNSNLALQYSESFEKKIDKILLRDVVLDDTVEINDPFMLPYQAEVILHKEQIPKSASSNILSCLQGNINVLKIRKSGSEKFRATMKGQSGAPLYLINGRPTTERSIQNIPHDNVEKVEIISNPVAKELFGSRARGGVISLFTDSDYKDELFLDDVANIILYQAFGFHKTRQFYSPEYDIVDYYALPDLRSTLYWEPMLALKTNENKSLSFYSPDAEGMYTVTLEGISHDGQPIIKKTSFEVRSMDY